MIGVKNQNQLVDEVVACLIHPTYPTSWNLVVPPGFGEDALSEQIVIKLRALEPKPFVAVVSSDSIQNVTAYVRQLHRQWSATCPIAQPIPDEAADILLQNLLGVLPTERPVIQVLKRFHKILDSLQVHGTGARTLKSRPPCSSRTRRFCLPCESRCDR